MIWLALDGVGHPNDALPGSPWEADLPTLRPLVNAGQAIDARLGFAGLPQSATGQTSWLTGRNAATVMHGHYGPRPGPTLRPLLAESLPARLARSGGRIELLNFYAPAYFGRTARGRNPHGCFPLSALLAGRALNPPGWPLVSPPLGLDFSAPWTAHTSLDELRHLGERVGEGAGNADLLLLDLWFSDFLGHQGGPGERPDLHAAARAYLERLDALLEGLLSVGTQVILSADHGNFENLTVKSHTLARVPFAGANLTLPPVQDIAEGGRAIAGLFGL